MRIAIDHEFRDPDLLRQALTHRSFGVPHNERLEFVGDAVLNCAIALSLYARFPDLPEGDLSRIRAHLVNRDTLARLARQLELGSSMRLGEGEQKSGGADRGSILADALEAIFGAVAIDAGYGAASRVIDGVFGELLHDADPRRLGKDPKTLLQEWLQSRRLPVPEYAIVATTGEAHAQQFTVECRIPALSIVASGTGSSRRVAEQDAAAQALAAATQGQRARSDA
ncbi:MAG: ribonuclease III [Betaproteobacteria bacterium]|nr:ribonuclease III [Betaproteobacteria bacterium]MDE2209096.1 ribonuclease III [Betaproteobacteria bacterium]